MLLCSTAAGVTVRFSCILRPHTPFHSELQILLYEAVMAAGITMLSIGHRPVLRRYHSLAVHFEGSQVR